jgi:HK97 family phage major capsid protein
MKSSTTTIREELKGLRARQDEKRDEIASFTKEIDEAKEAVAGHLASGGKAEEWDGFDASKELVEKRGDAQDELNALGQREVHLLELLGESVPDPRRSNGNGNGSSDAAEALGGWDAESLLAGEAYQGFIESGIIHSSGAKIGSVNLGRLADREASARFLAAEVGTANMQGAIPADRRGIITPNLKRLTLLDLIPTGTTDSNMVEYVQVVAIPGAAAEVAEGAVKPEETFTTVDADAPVRTIAGWIKVRKQALADVAGLRTLIGTLLPYDVRRRIESQMLVGDGVGQNLKGILNTTGIGAPAFVAGDNIADAILRAITVVVLSDADPNFVALHPLAQQDLMLMREDTGGPRTGAYLYGSPASPAAPTIWGLAMTANRAVPAATPLVGDAMGATLLVREGVNVLVSDSDQDDFIRNRATVLAEARVAFPVWRPSSFAVADTTA